MKTEETRMTIELKQPKTFGYGFKNFLTDLYTELDPNPFEITDRYDMSLDPDSPDVIPHTDMNILGIYYNRRLTRSECCNVKNKIYSLSKQYEYKINLIIEPNDCIITLDSFIQ